MSASRIPALLSLLCLLFFCHCGAEEAIDELFIDISGTVSNDGEPVTGALILLLDSPNLVDGVSLASASVCDSNGNYVIVGVESGDYYVVAIDDVNNNFEYDMGTDRIGFHGVNPSQLDLVPDLVRVSSEDLTGVDITYLVD